jgi:hypothetical protein
MTISPLCDLRHILDECQQMVQCRPSPRVSCRLLANFPPGHTTLRGEVMSRRPGLGGSVKMSVDWAAPTPQS